MIPVKASTESLGRLQRAGWGIGALGLVAAVAGLSLGGPNQFFQAYLFAFLFWLGLSLGSLGLVLLHTLVGGNWGWVIRRSLEAASRNLWFLALLFIPLIAGLAYLYPWMNPEEVASNPILQHKEPYLNLPFFLVRAAIYFGLWLILSLWITRRVASPDLHTEPLFRRRRQRISALGLILYFLTMTFASVDWIISLYPAWFSTIYGMLTVTGQSLAAMAFSLATIPLLLAYPPLHQATSPGHLRDLGALFLTMVVLWAYLAFAQYLVVWSGNIPREVIWYLDRFQGGWLWVGILVVVLQFILPFATLLPVQSKRDPILLSRLGLVVLIAGLLDVYWQVVPAFRVGRLAIHWLDFVLPLTIGGFWLALFSRSLERIPQVLLPTESTEARAEKNASQSAGQAAGGD